MSDHDELRRLAQAATPGPWVEELDESYSHIIGGDPDAAVDLAHVGSTRADAAFIAAANPATVIALLDERDELREQLSIAQNLADSATRDRVPRSDEAEQPEPNARELREYELAAERDAARAGLAAANARADRAEHRLGSIAQDLGMGEPDTVVAPITFDDPRWDQLRRHVGQMMARIDKAPAIQIPGPLILCDSTYDRDEQWRKAIRAALAADTPTPTDRCRCGHLRGDHWKGLVPPKVGICAGSTCGCQGFAADTPTTATAEGSDTDDDEFDCHCYKYASATCAECATAERGEG